MTSAANDSYYFIGVDVGTASVRAGLFVQPGGALLRTHVMPIAVYNTKTDFYEQSSEEIWQVVSECIRHVTKHVPSEHVLSVGFDATCSLVVLGDEDQPVSVSPVIKQDNVNVVMWMDHRAAAEADFINKTAHRLLKCVGGKISLEMDPPKLLWLKRHALETCYNRAKHFFSLPDYLVWRCSGVDTRSLCSVTCKWLFGEGQWDESFWRAIGLEDLCENNFDKIGGDRVKSPYSFCQELKVSAKAREETGLGEHVKVGIAMIDAHAGGVGALAMSLGALQLPEVSLTLQNDSITDFKTEILVLVTGTSTCFMATSRQPAFIEGIWGPYRSAMIEGFWLNEAGQTTSGKLLMHIIKSHPAYLARFREDIGSSIDADFIQELDKTLHDLAAEKKLSNVSFLTKGLHIYPDFHGNRSPLADSQMKGMVSGLGLDTSVSSLALLYLAALQALAYQTRQIVESLTKQQHHKFKLISLIGGLQVNKLYSQLISDVTEMPVILSSAGDDEACSAEAILLGACIAGAANTDLLRDATFDQLLEKFSGKHKQVLLTPCKVTREYHQKKYEIFLSLMHEQQKHRKLMEEF